MKNLNHTASTTDEPDILDLSLGAFPHCNALPFPREGPERPLHLDGIPDDELVESASHPTTSWKLGAWEVDPFKQNSSETTGGVMKVHNNHSLDEEVNESVFVLPRNRRIRSLDELVCSLSPESDEHVLAHR
jgi:hypothetical protein